MDIERKVQRYKTVKKRKVAVFKYTNKKTGINITDKKILDRISSLRIPPAYKNVKISTSIKNKIQAMGIDDKKRVQYIYNPSYVIKQSENKFKDLVLFGKNIKSIRKDVTRILKETGSGKRYLLSKNSLIAMVLYLVDVCNFRIGSQKYKLLYKTFGVTTLNKSHFKKMGENYSIQFIGKKMVSNSGVIKKKNICRLLDELIVKNKGEYIFNSIENGIKTRITEKHVNAFLKKYNSKLSVKMFRTWKANTILLKELLDYPLPGNKTDSKGNLQDIIKIVAEKLHHTKNVSKKSYMNNKIIELYSDSPNQFKKMLMNFKGKNNKLPEIDTLFSNFLDSFNKK